jgi:8-oxo-dGTP pyrophosphatase MutT (NUDIX family)
MPSTKKLETGRDDDDAEEDADQAGKHHPAPWRALPHARGEEDADEPADDQGEAQQQGQDGRRRERILQADDAGEDIECTEQQPQDAMAPVLGIERGDDLLSGAAEQHHEADDIDRDGRREDVSGQCDHAGDHGDDTEGHDPAPSGTQRADPLTETVRASTVSCGHGSALSLRKWTFVVYARRVALSQQVCDNRCMTEAPKKAPPAPRPATTVLLVRPSRPGDAASPLEVFMVVRHQQIDAFSGAIVFPGGKLEEADGDPRLRARCGGADRISADELKFRVAGVREAFEECGVLLARKPGQRAVVGTADLKGIEQRWRTKLAEDEASIVDLVEAENLELATDLMTPYAHWITPTFAPKRFDTWFFIAEAPEDQVALHDGSESVESVWIDPQTAIDEAKAGRRTLVHATTKNLELLAEAKTVAEALSQASQRKIITVQPWVEERDGKRFLHIPPDAGYRNLFRELPPIVSQTG